MNELSLYKLKQKTELIGTTKFGTLKTTNWNNNRISINIIDLDSYDVLSQTNGIKCIVSPDYSDTVLKNHLSDLSNYSIIVTCRMSDKIVILDFVTSIVPTFNIPFTVQFIGTADTIQESSVISNFPIGDGAGSKNVVTGIKVDDSTATGLIEFTGVNKDGNVIEVTDEKVLLKPTTFNSRTLCHLPFFMGTLNQCKNVFTMPYSDVDRMYIDPYGQQIKANIFRQTQFLRNQFWINNQGNDNFSANFDGARNTFEIGIRERETHDWNEDSHKRPWLSRIKFSLAETVPDPLDPTKTINRSNRITVDTPLFKIKSDKIDIDNDSTTPHRSTIISAPHSTLKIQNIKMGNKDLIDIIKYIATGGSTCIVGYDNSPFAQYCNYTIPHTTTTVTTRAAAFRTVLDDILKERTDPNNPHSSYKYNEILLIPGAYYLTGQTLIINRSNFTIRGVNQSTAIYCDEGTLSSNNFGTGMIDVQAGNVRFENLTLGCYYPYGSVKSMSENPDTYTSHGHNIDATERYYTKNALISIKGSGIEFVHINFTNPIIGGKNCNDSNVNNNVSNIADENGGFSFTEQTGLVRLISSSTYGSEYANYDYNHRGFGSPLAWMVAYTIYIADTNNVGIYDCVFGDTYTKYIGWRQYSSDCVSIVNGCRCVRNKDIYIHNLPISGCTARDLHISSSSSNTNLSGYEVTGSFKAKDYPNA